VPRTEPPIASRPSVDADLQREGLVRFLKPDWREPARIVLTTYETLRDLEFSFAKEPWSILVCDEAQKIKNPNALVTKAVKKLNVRFRVACTGTPVENSLTDLWCLFDMIQPGLLGALNAFGREYRSAIEAGSDRACAQLEKLRALVDPQVIRRTKAEVAKDLPEKIYVANCRLEMSNEQRAFYVGAVQRFDGRGTQDEEPGLHHLALLRYLRLVCAEPQGSAQVVEDDGLCGERARESRRAARELHLAGLWLMVVSPIGRPNLLSAKVAVSTARALAATPVPILTIPARIAALQLPLSDG
jgi:SNF2 family DNA or RNA helicase